MLALWLLALLLSTAFLAHRRTAPLPALGIVAGLLILMGVFSHAPVWLMGLLWLLLLAVALPLLLPQQRRSLFTAPLFAWFKRVLPPMSATERDAIERAPGLGHPARLPQGAAHRRRAGVYRWAH